jgi:hypothetical protein
MPDAEKETSSARGVVGQERSCEISSASVEFSYHGNRERLMRTLLEEIDELIGRAKYMEEKHPNSAMTPDFWTRLSSACEQARQFCPETLKNVVPDESQKTWAEALLCLEAVNEVLDPRAQP